MQHCSGNARGHCVFNRGAACSHENLLTPAAPHHRRWGTSHSFMKKLILGLAVIALVSFGPTGVGAGFSLQVTGLAGGQLQVLATNISGIVFLPRGTAHAWDVT